MSSLCSLAIVLPDYSVSYIKATIGDTITQAKCKYPPEHHSPLSNSVEDANLSASEMRSRSVNSWFLSREPPTAQPCTLRPFHISFFDTLTSSGDGTAWFLSCGLSSPDRTTTPLTAKAPYPVHITLVFLTNAPLCACLPSRPLSCGFWGRKANLKCPSFQESPHSSCTIFLFKASGVE